MNDKDTGNKTTQTMYELATEPNFIDRSQDTVQEVSWEVSDGEVPPLPPEKEEVKEEEQLPAEDTTEKLDQEDPVEEDQEEETEKEKKKKRNRTSEKNRISQLTKELRQAQAVAADVINRNQYLESKATQKEKENLETKENYLTSQKERVKKYLTDAIEEGDPSKIAEANDLLGQYNAEILWLNRQKQNVEPESTNTQPYTQPIYQDHVYTPDNKEAVNDWIENNSWANQNSDDFDRDLYEEADQYSIKLMKKYTIAGRKGEIGTPEFFNDITNYIHSKYEIDEETPSQPTKVQTKEKMQMKTHKSPHVGSVNRQVSHTESALRAKDVVLTDDQKDTAHRLRGFVKDPKTGKPITDSKTLEEIYKRNLMRGNG